MVVTFTSVAIPLKLRVIIASLQEIIDLWFVCSFMW